VAQTRDGQPVANALSTSVLSQIMQTREPYLRTEVDGDIALQRSASLSAQGVRPLIAVPLVYQTAERNGSGDPAGFSGVEQRVRPARRRASRRDRRPGRARDQNAMLVRQLHSCRATTGAGSSASCAACCRRGGSRRPAPLRARERVGDGACIDDRYGSLPARSSTGSPAFSADRLIGSEVRDQVSVGSPERTYTLAAHALDHLGAP